MHFGILARPDNSAKGRRLLRAYQIRVGLESHPVHPKKDK